MKDTMPNGVAAETVMDAPVEVKKDAKTPESDDFLAGIQGADAESFNVCISCD